MPNNEAVGPGPFQHFVIRTPRLLSAKQKQPGCHRTAGETRSVRYIENPTLILNNTRTS